MRSVSWSEFKMCVPFVGIHLGDVIVCEAKICVEEGPGSSLGQRDAGDCLVFTSRGPARIS